MNQRMKVRLLLQSDQSGRKSQKNAPRGKMSRTSTRATRFCWTWRKTLISMLPKVGFLQCVHSVIYLSPTYSFLWFIRGMSWIWLKLILLILTDMQGNIKALKYALNHELVYRDSAALLHKVGKPVPPYQKVTV